VDLELGPLPVELRLGDVATFAQHRGNEASHSHSIELVPYAGSVEGPHPTRGISVWNRQTSPAKLEEAKRDRSDAVV
jgi:hypothetical protein